MESIEELTKELVSLLDTDEPEYQLDSFKYNKANWQAEKARSIAIKLLNASNADGLCGCPLCQG